MSVQPPLLSPQRIQALRGKAAVDPLGVLMRPEELQVLLSAHESARSLAQSLPGLLGRLERSDSLLRSLVRHGGAPEVMAGVEAYLSKRSQEVPSV